MTDFNAKHRELYLEELKEVLNQYVDVKEHILNAENTVEREKCVTAKKYIFDQIFKLIGNFKFDNREDIILILKTLREKLPYEYFVNVCNYKFKDHETKSLQDILYKEYQNEFINLVLDNEVKDEQ
jgi:adenine C2-methylase RlmN of 23S rRNA A2503 and tRNA A37